jgi:hypothetical protein
MKSLEEQDREVNLEVERYSTSMIEWHRPFSFMKGNSRLVFAVRGMGDVPFGS